jgi:uncharacterized protein
MFKINNKDAKPNRLINEKSPYLLQHAYNPVDWHAWGDEAFEKAKKEDKPIFLSIGYSTCHWCHVMEQESFEDHDVAALMNEAFVSIKVDREERPDIDHIYMTICQMMTGSGGWPLNVVMTPDKRPFFAGTYFPKESRFGRIGMMDLTPRITELWKTKRGDMLRAADQIHSSLKNLPEDSPGAVPGYPLLDRAFNELGERFDPLNGGFGPAPKFPTAHNLFFLLRYWKRSKEAKALEMVEKTLRAMRNGGIYDHVGFGFHRYSTDSKWLVPHFEKMLYDQAMISMAYIEAYQATGREEYSQVVREIFTYILRDMTSPEGAFFSAEDADSEGHEGKFYVWNMNELSDILGEEDARLTSRVYNFGFGGNYKEESTGMLTGCNIPHMTKSIAEISAELKMAESELTQTLREIRQKLFEARESRIHPHKDDKILTDWNGLMIAALAKGAKALGRKDYATAARRAADFLLGAMRDGDDRLLHRFRDGDAALAAKADDYAFFIWGLIELYEATFEPRYLKAALELNDQFMERFWDDGTGGFYFTPADARDLPFRRKEIYDGATPSGNSVAMMNLLRLGRLTARPELEQKAEAISRAFAGNLEQIPSGYTQLLSALEFALGRSHEVVIVGKPEAFDTEEMFKRLRRSFQPNTVVLFKPEGNGEEAGSLPDFVASHGPIDDRATAFVCLNYNCNLPTTEPGKMLELLEA